MLYNIVYKAENEDKKHSVSVEWSSEVRKAIRELEEKGFEILYIENPYGY